MHYTQGGLDVENGKFYTVKSKYINLHCQNGECQNGNQWKFIKFSIWKIFHCRETFKPLSTYVLQWWSQGMIANFNDKGTQITYLFSPDLNYGESWWTFLYNCEIKITRTALYQGQCQILLGFCPWRGRIMHSMQNKLEEKPTNFCHELLSIPFFCSFSH